jgi:signal transduction histidine kinase
VGKGGGLSGYWGITIDVTERVKSEQIRDSLVRNFSHSIKTPVAMIDMANEMLRIAIESGNWGMVKKSFGMMRFNLKTLNNDLDNILESIAIQGRGPTISKVSLSGIINEITSKFEDQVALKNLGVTIDIASDADAAIADIGDLKTLFRNVMDNAVKFTSDGEIYISAKRKGNVVEVKVRDTGCGISAADVGMVKQKFFRVNPAVPGIGLGLSICSEIACRMGGSFEIFSEGKGKGVTVVIEIPAESGGAHVETK